MFYMGAPWDSERAGLLLLESVISAAELSQRQCDFFSKPMILWPQLFLASGRIVLRAVITSSPWYPLLPTVTGKMKTISTLFAVCAIAAPMSAQALSESFDYSTTAVFPPAGWSVTNNNAGAYVGFDEPAITPCSVGTLTSDSPNA